MRLKDENLLLRTMDDLVEYFDMPSVASPSSGSMSWLRFHIPSSEYMSHPPGFCWSRHHGPESTASNFLPRFKSALAELGGPRTRGF